MIDDEREVIEESWTKDRSSAEEQFGFPGGGVIDFVTEHNSLSLRWWPNKKEE